MNPISLEEAVRLSMPKGRDDLVPVFVRWIGPGWIVKYQSRAYLQSRSIFDRMVGGAYILVLNDGRLRELPATEPWQVAVVRLASELGLADELEPWVGEQVAHCMDS